MENSTAKGLRAPGDNVPAPQEEELVLALVAVNGATAACADHGDLAAFAVLTRYYELVARGAASAHGRIVKAMGDGVLIVFPRAHASDAIAALRATQFAATEEWQAFDIRCRVVIKAGVGRVLSGVFGPPGVEQRDIFGDALNQLFKLPVHDFEITPELRRIVE